LASNFLRPNFFGGAASLFYFCSTTFCSNNTFRSKHCEPKMLFRLLSFFFSQVHTITMHIMYVSFDNSTTLYKDLKTLHPGGFRTRDLLFCRRTR
jgi:hypothetical protein